MRNLAFTQPEAADPTAEKRMAGERLEGRVVISSNPGKGTLVKVEIPLSLPPETPAAEMAGATFQT